MQFIVSKKKTVVSTQHAAVFFVPNISKICDEYFTDNTKYTLQITILLLNIYYIIGFIPIMSRFLINKLNFLRV